MELLVYIIIYPLLWLISVLPFKLLYLLSNCCYVLVYYVIGYRKKIVTENLELVFPNKSKADISKIRKAFYKHLCDMLLEMIKSMTISTKSLKKRFHVINPQELKRLESLNQSIVLMYGHYASYEWSMTLENYVTYEGVAIYKRLKNKYFDKLVRDIRSKYNTTLITTKNTRTKLAELEANSKRVIIGFLSDQSPKVNKALYWTKFMGIKVPCFTGAELLAKKHNYATAYLKINKVKRGYYTGEIITLSENANTHKNFELTNLFLTQVEQQIHHAPEYYLWTHKRWKHRHNVPDKFKD